MAMDHQALWVPVVFKKNVEVTDLWFELPNLTLFPSHFSVSFASGAVNKSPLKTLGQSFLKTANLQKIAFIGCAPAHV